MSGQLGPLEAEEAHADFASFHFQKFVLRLPGTSSGQLLDAKALSGIRDTRNVHWGTLVHEMTHFFQATTTVLGQGVVLNWLGFLGEAAASFSDGLAIRLPLADFGFSRPKQQAFVKAWAKYIGEVSIFVGAALPPLDQHKLGQAVAFDFVEHEFVYSSDGLKTGTPAMVLPTSSGALLGVPLLGDVFLEGQAQAVQWLSDGSPASLQERLATRPVNAPASGERFDGYYTAVVRFVHTQLPGWDPLPTTILLCDLALCAQHPGRAFVAAYEILKKQRPPSGWSDFERLRKNFSLCSHWREGREFVLDKLADWEKDVGLHADLAVLVARLRAAWKARDANPVAFMGERYDGKWLIETAKLVGSPPVFLQGRDTAIRLIDDEPFERACFFVRGTYDLLEALVVRGLTGECPFLRTKVCDWHKGPACREGRLLEPPRNGNKSCHMGAAADALGLLDRAVERK